jgi:hypothetical protein
MTAKYASIFDLENAARKRLPQVIFDYIHGGSEQQLTLQRNLDDMRALALRQHSLRDVARQDTVVTMAGDPARIPLASARRPGRRSNSACPTACRPVRSTRSRTCPRLSKASPSGSSST